MRAARLVVLLASLLSLATALVPAPASAATFIVDGTGDSPDASGDGTCATQTGTCTLRAALQEASYQFSADTVGFSAAFDGGPEDETTIQSPLPVPPRTSIDAGRCGSASNPRPCAWFGYASSGGGAALRFSGGGSSIRGIAIGNAGSGIDGGVSDVRVSACWLGLHLDGSPSPDQIGIDLTTSGGVIIGGPTPGEANVFAGGKGAIRLRAAGAPSQIRGNSIGLSSTATPLEPPSEFGISTSGGAFNSQLTIASNVVAARGGPAIEATTGSTVSGNFVGVSPAGATLGGGTTGISITPGLSTYVPADLSSNVIGDVSGPGILINRGLATVAGNLVGADGGGAPHPNSGPGVLVFGRDPSVVIPGGGGGNGFAFTSYASEDLAPNMISNSGGPAIEIIGDDSDGNVIGQNFGTGNAGPFIDLGGDGLGNTTGVNSGITAPRITGASPTSAHGWAIAGATIYGYLSATGKPGDLTAPIGETTAGYDGFWHLEYPIMSAGASVAFTQLGVGRPRGGSEAAMRAIDGQSPRTRIRIVSASRPTVVRLLAEEGSTFRCAVDHARLHLCRAVLRLRLAPGHHRIRAQATDSSGNIEKKPAIRALTTR